MQLTKENIQEWKAELDKIMLEQHNIPEYSTCLRDEDWLDDYLGEEPIEAVKDEIDNWGD